MTTLSSCMIASRGYALGKAYVVDRPVLRAETHLIEEDHIISEINKFDTAVQETISQLTSIDDSLGIIRAHISLIQDDAFYNNVIQRIREKKQNVQLALKNAADDICAVFDAMKEASFKDKSADIRDITGRLMRSLKGAGPSEFEGITEPVILIAQELSPSDIFLMKQNYVLGFATQEGSITSHLSILAGSMKLPALVAVESLMENVHDGDPLILDACEGKLIIRPDEIKDRRIVENYKAASKLYYKKRKEEGTYDLLPASTLDGRVIKLYANAGSLDDIQRAVAHSIEGIGLLRSETLYMSYSSFPSEEEQFLAYKEVALLCKGDLIIRTLDIGGDKALPYYPLKQEDNPFLGWRGIRISLNTEEIFKTQLRAILRAAIYGNIKIMYPMISSLEELIKANHILSSCKDELKAQGFPYKSELKVGIMMETPAAVLCAEELARQVDFFSIGTNDLTQYLLAVDRGNPKVSSLYNPFHPAVIRSLKTIIDAAHTHNIDVSICGALAGDDRATLLLLGLGLDKLSIPVSEISKIKSTIRNLSYERAKECARKAIKASTIEEVMNCLKPDKMC